MKRTVLRLLLWMSLLFAVVAYLSGCAITNPTKPNIPFAGHPYPSVLDKLSQKNSMLAQELGKLPELQDGISQEETFALEGIVDLYSKAPAAFDNAFKQMYQVGKPEVRKYCTPLQAIYWLVKDGKEHSVVRNAIVQYDLNQLLHNAWQYAPDEIKLSESHILYLINDLTKIQGKKSDDKWMQDLDRTLLKKIILSNYMIRPKVYSRKARNLIEKSFLKGSNASYQRWKDFKTVTERLNAPKIIDIYQRKNFSYATTSAGYGCGGVDISISTRSCSPSYIYHTKKGNCAAYTTHAVNCLKQAGYEAYPIKVFIKWPSSFVPRAFPRDYHYLVIYNEMDKWYTMNTGGGMPAGIKGPFNSLEELPFKVLNIEGKKK